MLRDPMVTPEVRMLFLVLLSWHANGVGRGSAGLEADLVPNGFRKSLKNPLVPEEDLPDLRQLALDAGEAFLAPGEKLGESDGMLRELVEECRLVACQRRLPVDENGLSFLEPSTRNGATHDPPLQIVRRHPHRL